MKKIVILSMLSFSIFCCSSKVHTPETPGQVPSGPEPKEYVYVSNGRFYRPDGSELSLWGVNFQPCLKWEYEDRLRQRGINETSEDLMKVVDNNLEDLSRIGVSLIRCHLTPADFTDDRGNLVQSPYLDVLDYMVAEAAERGIYVTLTFINHMRDGYVSSSLYNSAERADWIHDSDIVEKSENYISALLSRTNKYTGRTYASEPYIAYWELLNEPDFYQYDEISSHAAAKRGYQEWLDTNSESDTEESYSLYREWLVRDYISGMKHLIQDNGGQQPVCWSLNWHKYRIGNEDIFKGVAESEIDAVSFCNYPGQDLVSQDYWNNPKDLSATDFTSWFSDNYNNADGYGWLLSNEFAAKAKVVYEFETFFNLSSYLYPIQAQYFRSLGVQAASMWTYTVREAAEYFAGSHFLSTVATPGKVLGFMVAKEIFRNTGLLKKYPTNVNEQLSSEGYAISKSRDICIYSDEDIFIHSADAVEWCPLKVYPTVRKIAGRGNSSLVEYTGSGMYIIEESGDELFLSIYPDMEWIKDPWNSLNKNTLVTRLTEDAANVLTISLSRWTAGDYELFKIENGNRISLEEFSELKDISITPGDYVIVRK